MQSPVYRATATVLIDVEQPNVMAVSTKRDETMVARGQHYMGYGDYYRTQLEVITGRAIAERVFENLKLHEQAQYASATDAIGGLLGQVVVEPAKATRLADIHVEDPDPVQAARIANEFALVFAEENLVKTMTAEAMNLMKNEYLTLQTKESELSKRYKAKHPRMVRIREEKNDLARAIEQQLRQQLDGARRKAEGRAVASAGDIPKSVLERLGEFTMGSLRANNIQVKDLAQVPTRPVRPRKALNLFLALFFGLLGGLGMAAVQEQFDTSLKLPEDIEEDERFVLLGYVPRIDGLPVKSDNGLPVKSTNVVKSKSRRRYQCVHLGPYSRSTEAYRALRTSLLYAAPAGDARAIVVTSPGTEEGKTTTVTNLGIALSQNGLKVLIVDADLRKGRLHDVLELKRDPGLSEFLVGRASFEAVVQPTRIEGLSVVSNGRTAPNPSELLGSAKMREFIKQATARFDRVLVDSPPATAVTDAVILAAVIETVLAVAQSGRTPREALYQLTAACRGVRAKVLGVVLNNVPDLDTPAYYRYAAYRYAPPKQDGKGKRAS